MSSFSISSLSNVPLDSRQRSQIVTDLDSRQVPADLDFGFAIDLQVDSEIMTVPVTAASLRITGPRPDGSAGRHFPVICALSFAEAATVEGTLHQFPLNAVGIERQAKAAAKAAAKGQTGYAGRRKAPAASAAAATPTEQLVAQAVAAALAAAGITPAPSVPVAPAQPAEPVGNPVTNALRALAVKATAGHRKVTEIATAASAAVTVEPTALAVGQTVKIDGDLYEIVKTPTGRRGLHKLA